MEFVFCIICSTSVHSYQLPSLVYHLSVTNSTQLVSIHGLTLFSVVDLVGSFSYLYPNYKMCKVVYSAFHGPALFTGGNLALCVCSGGL